ncbi:MAG: tRNA (N(6)-L-threonylcarbamoyladenosine(37)-C(2))-methylthiotransferase [Candidatus Thorarchaeota archaeon]
MQQTQEQKKKVSVMNYGCTANLSIAEGMMGILRNTGYTITSSVDEADTVVVNTCIVKQNTEHRMKSLLLSLAETKEVVVTGCLPVAMQSWVEQHVPAAKILFPENADQLPGLLEDIPLVNTSWEDPVDWARLYDAPRIRFNPVVGNIEISRGCLGQCTFCIVKSTKGHLRSRSPDNILHEIKIALTTGVKEIRLTSQDVGPYGWDLRPRQDITSLLCSIATLPEQFFVRLGMMTPKSVARYIDPLIEQLMQEKIYTHLHLPIQSGANSILRAMRRLETAKYFTDLVHHLREEVPMFTLATDVIVGFPGESPQDYAATRNLLKEVRPAIVNLSKYTDRPGTSAAQMGNKVPSHIKAKRSQEIGTLIRQITYSELKKWVGWEGTMLINERGKYPDQFVGRNSSYLPVVLSGGNLKLGDFIQVQIIDAGPTYLMGEEKR